MLIMFYNLIHMKFFLFINICPTTFSSALIVLIVYNMEILLTTQCLGGLIMLVKRKFS